MRPLVLIFLATAAIAQPLHLEKLGTYQTNIFAGSAAEIPAYDPASKRLFVVNFAQQRIDVLNLADPANPTFAFQISAPVNCGALPNSVAVKNGLVAIAFEALVRTNPGYVLFTDVNGLNGRCVQAGALPDMLTFTPDGTKVLVANEGEPNDAYSIDPEGSVSIIDVSGGLASIDQSKVQTAGFTAFNAPTPIDPNIRIFGPGASVAQDLEPEYIAVTPDSKTAYVSLQENNAIGILDIATATFTSLKALGFKNHNVAGNGLDASDRDNQINIANWPVFGMYQPDAIATFESGGNQYIVSANEGDARAYAGFDEEVRVGAGGYVLDPAAFPNASTLKQNANLGRLTVTRATGDDTGDGRFNRILAFGARSFSIWDSNVNLVYDSGDDIEKRTAKLNPTFFNSNHEENAFDNRSDNKGPEPEAVAVGAVNGTQYAFVGLERIGGVMAYSLTNPASPEFAHYSNNRDFTVEPNAGTVNGTVGDLGAEGLIFIQPSDSPNGKPLVVVANEVSGSTTIFEAKPLQSLASKVTVQIGGVAFNNLTNTWFATIVLRNRTSAAIPGPIFAAFDKLPAGVELVNPAGLLDTGVYKQVSANGLSRNQAITLRVEFRNPGGARIAFAPSFYN
jgi:2',3'-cyclic-nucleotide 2'-phosphodiesterase/3'-nucleotidase/5'-nucleotidase